MAQHVDVVVIGAGHSGLAMSHVLARRGIAHVVLERGELANSWRTERWDSMRLLTPNWMTHLPGSRYAGPDPDGFMAAREVGDFIARYARAVAAPVHLHTTVSEVCADRTGYEVITDQGQWRCRAVVLANGAFGKPIVPACAAAIPANVAQWSTATYRHPAQLNDGGVLVVGASATGVQLARELQRSGRRVTLAVGEHVRLPRRYRGRDIQWWMHVSGVLDQCIENIDDPQRARRVPSPQLVGSPAFDDADLNTLQALGVEVVGRLTGIRDGTALFSGGLRNVCALADLKMSRLLDAADAWAEHSGVAASVDPSERFAPTHLPANPRLSLALGTDARTIVWATGATPDYHWLRMPVFGADGALKHDRGVVAPGLYALGLPFLRRRKSSFIHGAEDDVDELAGHLADHLDSVARSARVALR